jgi:hypothetical protein
MTVIGGGRGQRIPISSGHYHLSEEADTDCVLADTYYQISGTFTGGDSNFRYTTAGDGTLTYLGLSGLRQFTQVKVDVGVDKACALTVALFVNETEADHVTHTFLAQDKDSWVGLLDPLVLDQNDEVTVRVKSSVADTTATVESISVMIVGEPS